MHMENIFRTIGYVLLFAINALLYYFLHSHFHFIVLILMAISPLLSLMMAIIMKKFISVKVRAASDFNKTNDSTYGNQNEEVFIYVSVINPTPFVCLDAKLNIKVRNTFFETEGSQIISVPIHAIKGYELELPIIASLPGIVSVEVADIKIKDLMGFCFFKKTLKASGDTTVMPELISDFEYDKTALEQGMLESEESSKKGHDFSDVQDIREYIPGDKLMSIHWKLSAKRDILMVKDRVTMSDKQLVILPELFGGDANLLNMILVSTYSIIMQLINDKTTVRLMYWSSASYEYEDIRIDYRGELCDAFAKMFYEKTYQSMDEAASNMLNVHPEIKAYLHISADENGAIIKVRENG